MSYRLIVFLTCSLVLSLAGSASSASLDGNIEWDGLFHDQGPVFINTCEPNVDTEIRLRFRAFKNDLASARIKYVDLSNSSSHEVPMTKEKAGPSSDYDYWEGSIPAGSSRKLYRFLLQDGHSKVWYNAKGPAIAESADGDFFVLPGFKTPEWLKNGVIYQIFPDRFFNGEYTNDIHDGESRYSGVSAVVRPWDSASLLPPGKDQNTIFFNGDLTGIILKLEYIRKCLGANIIYLNPVFKAPSNHRYDTADFDVVDSALGDNQSLAELAAKVHEVQNGKPGYLILDGVFNHTGDRHKWFGRFGTTSGTGAYEIQNSPYHDYYSFAHWPDDYAKFQSYEHLPKLNYGSESLRNEIYRAPNSVAQRYLAAPYVVDGWRLDAPKYVDSNGNDGEDSFNHSVWREFREVIKSVHPQAAIIGECWEEASPWTAAGDQWDAATNFEGFTKPVSRWITGQNYKGNYEPLSTSGLDRDLRFTRAKYPTNVQQSMSNHLSNHDTIRFARRAGGDIWKTYLALFLQMTYIGVPTIYYGDEYGMDGGADPDNRRPFDWSQTNHDNEAISLTKKLISIRSKYPALRTGSFLTLRADDSDGIFAFGRLDKSNAIVVILNNSLAEQKVKIPVRALELMDGIRLTDEISGNMYQVQSGAILVRIPGHYGAILAQ